MPTFIGEFRHSPQEAIVTTLGCRNARAFHSYPAGSLLVTDARAIPVPGGNYEVIFEMTEIPAAQPGDPKTTAWSWWEAYPLADFTALEGLTPS